MLYSSTALGFFYNLWHQGKTFFQHISQLLLLLLEVPTAAAFFSLCALCRVGRQFLQEATTIPCCAAQSKTDDFQVAHAAENGQI